MNFQDKLLRFVEHYSNAFFVGSLTTHQTTYVNSTATELFGMTVENIDFNKIFNTTELKLSNIIQNSLEHSDSCLLYNHFATKKDGTQLLADIQIGFFDQEKTEIYMEIIPHVENIENTTLFQVTYSSRAAAVLNYDKNLGIYHCNHHFYYFFQGNNHTSLEKYEMKMGNTFLPEEREQHLVDILEGLKENDCYYTELEISTLSGERKWISMDLQKKNFSENENKVLCYLADITEKIKGQEEHFLFNQYLSVIQETSDDILYRVDLATNTMYYFTESIEKGGSEKAIPDYVNVFMRDNIVHPEDQATYLESFQSFYESDVLTSKPVRFALNANNYQWYLIRGKKIYDSSGTLKEVFGALVNIEKEYKMESQVTSLNQYFDALQSISGESFFRIDIKNKVLNQTGDVANELGLNVITSGYPENVLHIIHPDDVQAYRDFALNCLNGIGRKIELRCKTLDGVYQWYEKETVPIENHTGEISEVVGKMNNIHAEKAMAAQVSSLNKYIEAVQSLSGESLYYVDLKTRILRQKGSVALELGVPPEIPDYPQGAYPFVHPEDLEHFKHFAEKTLGGTDSVVEIRVMTACGDYKWYEIISILITDDTGELIEIFGRMTNIQEERTMKEDFSTLNQYFAAMQHLSEDILFRIDVASQTFYHTDENALKFGVPNKIPNFIERFIQMELIPPEDADLYREYNRRLLLGENMQYQMKAAVAVGVYEWFDIRCEFIYNAKGETTEIFGTMKNIQDHKNLEAKAQHDLMTGALNKVTFEDTIAYILETSPPSQNHALIFIDLDDFKCVNDNLGHCCGDELLIAVTKRLKNTVNQHGIVGRIGGDEFAVFLQEIPNTDWSVTKTQELLLALQETFSYGQQPLEIKASIGLAIFPDHGTSYKELIEKADVAVYQSKKAGKNTVSLYTPTE